MKRIAIVETLETYNNYDSYDRIVDKITDFADVEDEVYKKLINAQHKFGFSVVLIPTDLNGFIENTVAKYDKMVSEELENQRKASEKTAEKRRLNLAKKKKEAEAKEKKKLEELIKKHGIPKI